MENNVVTLETAKKLRVAGFPPDTAFYWAITMTTDWHLSWYDGELPEALKGRAYAAPTAQEIADRLLDLRRNGKLSPENLIMNANGVGYQFGWGSTERTNHEPTMAEALAALWIKLKENK